MPPLEHLSAVGDPLGAAVAQLHAANVMAGHREPSETVAAFREAVERFRAAHDARGVLTALANLSGFAWRVGAHEDAWRSEVERAVIASRLELHNTLHDALATLARRAVEVGDLPLAERLEVAAQRADPTVGLLLGELRLQLPASIVGLARRPWCRRGSTS